MKLTKLEQAFIDQIITSEYAEWVETDEAGWVGDWVVEPYYDMKVVRGLITSLNQKGIIDVGDHQKSFAEKDMVWISIKPKYLDFDNYTIKEEVIDINIYDTGRK